MIWYDNVRAALFIRASSPNLIQVDTGQSGLTPPAGFTWLEPE